MKDSPHRAPKTGIAVRGNKSKLPRRDSKTPPIPDSDNLDASFAFTPSPFSTSTYSSISPAGDLEDVSSSSPARSLLFENSSDPSDLLVVDDAAITSSIMPATLSLVAGGGGDSDEIWTESSWQRKSEAEREVKPEKAMMMFSKAVENLDDSITELLLSSMKPRTRDQFSPRRLAEMALACFVTAMIVLMIIATAAPGCGQIWTDPSVFNGPAPT